MPLFLSFSFYLLSTFRPAKSFIFKKGLRKKISVSFRNPVFNGDIKKRLPEEYHVESVEANEAETKDNEAGFGNPMFGEYVDETGVFIRF